MALLSLDMIREIRSVADAYTARERARLSTPVVNNEGRVARPRQEEAVDSNR